MLSSSESLRGVAFVSPNSMSNINCIKGMEFGKKRAAKDGGGINQQRLAPALRKNGQNAEPTSENAESDRLLALKNEERSIRKQFNEQMKAMQEGFEKRIAEKRHEIEEARAAIRSKGDIEPDSLLFIGADLISKVLLYLKPRKMFRLGVVCKCFQKATHLCLVGMDSMTAECDRADMDCPKARATYYLIASKFAERQFKRISDRRFFTIGCRPYEGLNLVKFYNRNRATERSAEYLFFVRFGKMASYGNNENESRSTLLAQGFIRPHFDLEQKQIHLGIESFDFMKWPLMASLFGPNEKGDEEQCIHVNEGTMRNIFRSVSVVIIALKKSRKKVIKNVHCSLVFMANDFGRPDSKYSSDISDSDAYTDDSNLPRRRRRCDWQRHMAHTYSPDSYVGNMGMGSPGKGPGIFGTLCFGQSDEDKSACPSDSQIVLRIDQKLAVAAAEEERGDDNSSSTNSDDLALSYRCRGKGGGGNSSSSSSDESDSTEESDSGSDDNASM